MAMLGSHKKSPSEGGLSFINLGELKAYCVQGMLSIGASEKSRKIMNERVLR